MRLATNDSRLDDSRTAVLFYDDDCGFCLWSARFFERWTFGRVRKSALNSEEADRVLGDQPTELRFDQAWTLHNGRLLGGWEAMWELIYMLPVGFLLRPLRFLPGFGLLSHRIYRAIADSRNPRCKARAAARRAD